MEQQLTINPTVSDGVRRSEVMSMNPTAGWAGTPALAPYPLSARCSWLWSPGSGLWQCQNSIISAQFSLGRSFHVDIALAGRTSLPQ
jgi:hypothetical protein